MHMTTDEGAPCPAAHVIVMSMCSECGQCLFKDVKCLNKQGIAHSSRGEFMYRKYEESSEGGVLPEAAVGESPPMLPQRLGLPAGVLSGLGMVAVAGGLTATLAFLALRPARARPRARLLVHAGYGDDELPTVEE